MSSLTGVFTIYAVRMMVDQSRTRQADSGDRRAGARRAQLLQALQRAPAGLDVRELGERLGLHENTVRFHLDRLVRERAVERRSERTAGPGRPRLRFRARMSGEGIPGEQRNYELLARILTGFVAESATDPRAAAVAAGEAWGGSRVSRPASYDDVDREESVSELVSMLAEIGFEPEPGLAEQGWTHEIKLRHCPFLELAHENREVACSVHLGLMRGALTHMRAPETTVQLEPFVGPSLCIVRLAEKVAG